MDDQLTRELDLLYSRVCHALGDPKRLMILYALSRGPRYVSEMANELDMPQPTVSRHLKVLRDRDLVTATRDANTVVYALADDRVIQALDLLRAMLRDGLANQARLAEFTALDAEIDQ